MLFKQITQTNTKKHEKTISLKVSSLKKVLTAKFGFANFVSEVSQFLFGPNPDFISNLSIFRRKYVYSLIE